MTPLKKRALERIGYVTAILLSTAVCAALLLLLDSKEFVYEQSSITATTSTPFPVSVDPSRQLISEDPHFEAFYSNTLAQHIEQESSWKNKLAAVLMTEHWYQSLAAPVSRVIVIWPGERKEQLTKNIGDVLRWTTAERAAFTSLMINTPPGLDEGTFFPGQYTAHRHATPQDIAAMVTEMYQSEVLDRYTDEVAARVPLEQALIIASLIEREANTFQNKREVSGVIWNRLFIDMPLQLDATLQYARSNNTYESAWWPRVHPNDKFIESAYNTYQNPGLPPAPIANPSIESIVAALNPIETPCLYYFHTESGGYVCTETYEQHVQELRDRYGRGS